MLRFVNGRITTFACISLIAIYVVLDIVIQVLSPNYSVISQPESVLAVGTYGFLMTINFVIRAILSGLFALALIKSVPPDSESIFRGSLILFGLWGVGSLIMATFHTDLKTPPTTVSGTVHTYSMFAAFLCAGFSTFTIANDFRKAGELKPLSQLTFPVGIAAIIFSVITIVTAIFPPLALNAWGLIERVFIGLILLWILLVCINVIRFPLKGIGRN
jgi:hypothetical protein